MAVTGDATPVTPARAGPLREVLGNHGLRRIQLAWALGIAGVAFVDGAPVVQP